MRQSTTLRQSKPRPRPSILLFEEIPQSRQGTVEEGTDRSLAALHLERDLCNGEPQHPGQGDDGPMSLLQRIESPLELLGFFAPHGDAARAQDVSIETRALQVVALDLGVSVAALPSPVALSVA